ncbi:MAG: acyl-CoA dehydrogenase family protein, partial [Planctomycetota bacterium]|jgi:hypothetical protein
MVRYGPALQFRQAPLGRMVDEALDLTAMSVAISRAASRGDDASTELADLFCRHARARIRTARDVRTSRDRLATKVGHGVLDGRYARLEEGIVPFDERRSG